MGCPTLAAFPLARHLPTGVGARTLGKEVALTVVLREDGGVHLYFKHRLGVLGQVELPGAQVEP